MKALLICLFLALPQAVRAQDQPDPAQDCVILLHGLFRTEYSMAALGVVLEAQGYKVVIPGYPTTEDRVERLALEVLPAAVADCGERQVHFVAHSLGGILLRYWLQDNRPERLGRVVMLGPPNNGSELVDVLGGVEIVAWLHGPAFSQLGTGPDSLPLNLPPVDFPLGVIAGSQSLNAAASAVIPGPDDGKVSIESTKVEGMADHIVLPVTHTYMMQAPESVVQVVAFLKEGHFDPDADWWELLDERLLDCLLGRCNGD